MLADWKKRRANKPNISLLSHYSTKFWIFGLCLLDWILFVPMMFINSDMMSIIVPDSFICVPFIFGSIGIGVYGGSVSHKEDMELTVGRVLVDFFIFAITFLIFHFEMSNILYMKGNDVFSEKEFLKEEVIFKSYSGDIETVVLPKVPADCVNRDDVSYPYRNCLSVIEVLSGAKFRHFSSRSLSHAKIKLENVRDDKVTLYFRLGYYGIYVNDN